MNIYIMNKILFILISNSKKLGWVPQRPQI